jgi:adenylate cyclase class 2
MLPDLLESNLPGWSTPHSTVVSGCGSRPDSYRCLTPHLPRIRPRRLFIIDPAVHNGAHPRVVGGRLNGMTDMNGRRLIVEIKARCPDPILVRRVLGERDAEFIGQDEQTDTYFHVPHGRLKLREGRIENALIHYHRPDQGPPKDSDVSLYASEHPGELKRILTVALGVRQVVVKHRDIWFVDNVKVHLDRVEGLDGHFVEIEAIGDAGADRAELDAQCREWMTRLCVTDADLVSGSYSDMSNGATA